MEHIKSGLILDDKWTELDIYPCNRCVERITPSPGKSTHTSLGISGCFHQFLVERRLQIFVLILFQAQVILVQSALDYQFGSLNLRRIKILQQLTDRYTGTVILVYTFRSFKGFIFDFLSSYWTLKIKSERIFWLYIGCDLKDKRKLNVVLLPYSLMSINRRYWNKKF